MNKSRALEVTFDTNCSDEFATHSTATFLARGNLAKWV